MTTLFQREEVLSKVTEFIHSTEPHGDNSHYLLWGKDGNE